MILQYSSHTLAQHNVTEFPFTIHTYHAIIDDNMIYFHDNMIYFHHHTK
jgi:hypothetical protein